MARDLRRNSQAMVHPHMPDVISLRFPADAFAARWALQELQATLVTLGFEERHQNSILIAVAEAINNIVEHAFAGLGTGQVTLTCRQDPEAFSVVLEDNGNPLPGLQLPDGIAANVDQPLSQMPEGGFGWFLIRQLADSVFYDRNEGRNHLVLSFHL